MAPIQYMCLICTLNIVICIGTHDMKIIFMITNYTKIIPTQNIIRMPFQLEYYQNTTTIITSFPLMSDLYIYTPQKANIICVNYEDEE